MLDEFEIEDSLRNDRNPCGQLHRDHFPAIVKAIFGLQFIRLADKQAIAAFLT